MAAALDNELPPRPPLTTSAGNDRQKQAEDAYPSHPNPPPEGFMQKFRLYETRSVFILLTIFFCFWYVKTFAPRACKQYKNKIFRLLGSLFDLVCHQEFANIINELICKYNHWVSCNSLSMSACFIICAYEVLLLLMSYNYKDAKLVLVGFRMHAGFVSVGCLGL